MDKRRARGKDGAIHKAERDLTHCMGQSCQHLLSNPRVCTLSVSSAHIQMCKPTLELAKVN